MKTRKGSHDEVPSDDIENWLHDLVGGETTARKFRQRLRAEGATSEDKCSVCENAATGTHYFGLDEHAHGRRSA